jgi:hypothetical protein
MKTAAFIIGLVLLGCSSGWGAVEPYGCEKIWPGTIRIDGKLDEPAWKVAFAMNLADARTGEKPRQDTTVKMLWDKRFLYVAFACQDRHIWSTLMQRDDPVYTEEAVEVFIAPQGPAKPYYEFDVNPLGTLFDTRIEDKTLLGINTIKWKKAFNSQTKCAVKIDGTVNDARDEDKGWTVEMAIPLKDLLGPEGNMPQAGEQWRMNFYRVDKPLDAKEPELTAWSATGPSFHEPDKFGTIIFQDTFFYRCQRVKTGSIKVDGALDEPAWQKAKEVGRFRISGNGAFATQATVAKMLWDEKYIYLGFQCDDTDIWATLKEHDDDLWQEDVVEAFIAPPYMKNGYFEFEFNPLNALLDMVVVNPPGARKVYFNKQFDARNVLSAVSINGTLNNHNDIDKGWTAEVAIPFADLVSDKEHGPSVGDTWRIGLYRCEVAKDASPSEYSAWSPTGSWFHVPRQFGAVTFVEEQ